jgi:hypothetical protein
MLHATFSPVHIGVELVWRLYDHDRNHSGGNNDVDTVEKCRSLRFAVLISFRSINAMYINQRLVVWGVFSILLVHISVNAWLLTHAVGECFIFSN